MTKKCLYPSLQHGKCLFVSRLAGADKRRVSKWWRKCRSSLPALTDLRPEKDVSICTNLSRVNKDFGCRWNPRLHVCQIRRHKQRHEFGELGELWGRKLFVHYRQDAQCRVHWHTQTGANEEGFYSPARPWLKLTSENAVSHFCAPELTFNITGGQNEPASQSTEPIWTAWNLTQLFLIQHLHWNSFNVFWWVMCTQRVMFTLTSHTLVTFKYVSVDLYTFNQEFIEVIL